MSLHDDTPERLDADFDRYLSDMKPYVLKHPNRTGKMTQLVDDFMYLIFICVFNIHYPPPVSISFKNAFHYSW